MSGDTGARSQHGIKARTKRKLNATTNSDDAVIRLFKMALLCIKAVHKVLTRDVRNARLVGFEWGQVSILFV